MKVEYISEELLVLQAQHGDKYSQEILLKYLGWKVSRRIK
jgi:hypothetical protein